MLSLKEINKMEEKVNASKENLKLVKESEAKAEKLEKEKCDKNPFLHNETFWKVKVPIVNRGTWNLNK